MVDRPGLGPLDPAVAAIRTAVTRSLAGAGGPRRLLVACSGGPDSLALAAAAIFVAPRCGWAAGLTTVDHQLQAGSAVRADAVARWAAAVGFDPVEVRTVSVEGRSGGPEAAARSARYGALVDSAHGQGASRILLGHTRDDQAETVLLSLLRGSGPHGLSAMPAERMLDGVTLSRPLLDRPRAETRSACAAQRLTPWQDPHNSDPAFARSRARDLLGLLVDELGPAVVPNLARTARLAAADTAVLDDLAATALAQASAPAPLPPPPPPPTPHSPAPALSVEVLLGLPVAIRTRVLHRWLTTLGCPSGSVSEVHVSALDSLIVDWHGQGPAWLPGGLSVRRTGGWLRAGHLDDADGGR